MSPEWTKSTTVNAQAWCGFGRRVRRCFPIFFEFYALRVCFAMQHVNAFISGSLVLLSTVGLWAYCQTQSCLVFGVRSCINSILLININSSSQERVHLANSLFEWCDVLVNFQRLDCTYSHPSWAAFWNRSLVERTGFVLATSPFIMRSYN